MLTNKPQALNMVHDILAKHLYLFSKYIVAGRRGTACTGCKSGLNIDCIVKFAKAEFAFLIQDLKSEAHSRKLRTEKEDT